MYPTAQPNPQFVLGIGAWICHNSEPSWGETQHITQNFPLLAPNEYDKEKERTKTKTKRRFKIFLFWGENMVEKRKCCVKRNRLYAHS